jgi:uncharacterized membrane protein YdjX (TVP38/TMEM64 family)
LIGVAVLSALIFALRNFQLPNCAEIQTTLDAWGVWAPLLFVLLYVVATVSFIPGTIVTLMAGLAFGALWGTVIVSVSATIGAILAFLIARYMARDAIEGLLEKQAWFTKFKGSVEDNGFNFVLFARLVPIFPFNGLNYACGLVPLKLRDYAIASYVGMLPGTFAYVYLGATGCKIIDSVIAGNANLLTDLPPEVRTSLFVAMGLLIGLSLLPLALKKLRPKAKTAA